MAYIGYNINQIVNVGKIDSAFGKANTANTTSVAAFEQANTANTTSIAAFAQANTAYSSAVLKTGNTMTGNLVMSGANIAFATATNSGIYWSGTSFIHSPAANTLVLGTSSVEDIRIDSNGRVGIGTAAPTANLHVTGNVTALAIDISGANVYSYMTGLPQNSQSAAYGLLASDAGKHILHPSADTTARTFTIPANSSVSYPIGTAITFINQHAAGNLTIAITTDTMRLAGGSSTGNRTLVANGVATAIKITFTEWIISGVGLT